MSTVDEWLKNPHADVRLAATFAVRESLENFGFIGEQTLKLITAAGSPFGAEMLLVRCGGCRFLVPADQCAHLVAIIEREGSDYVRDVCFPADSLPRLRRKVGGNPS